MSVFFFLHVHIGELPFSWTEWRWQFRDQLTLLLVNTKGMWAGAGGYLREMNFCYCLLEPSPLTPACVRHCSCRGGASRCTCMVGALCWSRKPLSPSHSVLFHTSYSPEPSEPRWTNWTGVWESTEVVHQMWRVRSSELERFLIVFDLGSGIHQIPF
jgi:hypothetical protein